VITGPALQRIDILSRDGKLVHTKFVNGLAGYFNMTIPQLQKGIYFVRLSGKDFEKTEKIFIQ
jgi:hypothetical protein